jgi:SRR1 domain
MLFMPHCGVELYENILQQNWNTKGLQRILLIGNVLQEYETG